MSEEKNSSFGFFPLGLPRRDQCCWREQAAAAGDGPAFGKDKSGQQGGRDPEQTLQSQRALATPAGPDCSQVSEDEERLNSTHIKITKMIIYHVICLKKVLRPSLIIF